MCGQKIRQYEQRGSCLAVTSLDIFVLGLNVIQWSSHRNPHTKCKTVSFLLEMLSTIKLKELTGGQLGKYPQSVAP